VINRAHGVWEANTVHLHPDLRWNGCHVKAADLQSSAGFPTTNTHQHYPAGEQLFLKAAASQMNRKAQTGDMAW
jgi:hypothetical protein